MAATASAALRPKDYKSDLKPVWCPGCGDFAVLAAITKALAKQTPDRIRVIAQAMRHGLSDDDINAVTKFDPWFLARIREIIEATIGPVCVVDCIDEPEACPRADYCECRVVYALINLRIGEVLEDFTLADLADPSWMKERGESVASQLVGLSTRTQNP